jgi:hypothetical protein
MRDLDCQRGDIVSTTNKIKALEFSYFVEQNKEIA